MFFTQNPIGSSATEDLQDNAISFDYAMNSPAALWQDRFGKQHKTVQQALKDVGFKPAGFDFVSGGTLGIGDRDKSVFYPTDGYWYSWNGKLPYVVPVNSTPTPGGKKGWGVITRKEKENFDYISNVDGNVILGDKIWVSEYSAGSGSGPLYFKVVPANSGLHDGGKFIDLPKSGLQLEQNLKTPYDPRAWGARGDFNPQTGAGTSNREFIQRTIDYVQLLGQGVIELSDGNYYLGGDRKPGSNPNLDIQLLIGSIWSEGKGYVNNITLRGSNASLYAGRSGRIITVAKSKNITIEGLRFFHYVGGNIAGFRGISDNAIRICDGSSEINIFNCYLTNHLGWGIDITSDSEDPATNKYMCSKIKIYRNIIKTRFGNGTRAYNTLSEPGAVQGTGGAWCIAIINGEYIDIYDNTLIGNIDLENNATGQTFNFINIFNNSFVSGWVTPHTDIDSDFWHDEPMHPVGTAGKSELKQGVLFNGVGLSLPPKGIVVRDNNFENGEIISYSKYRLMVISNYFFKGRIIVGYEQGGEQITSNPYIYNNHAVTTPDPDAFIKILGLLTDATVSMNSLDDPIVETIKGFNVAGRSYYTPSDYRGNRLKTPVPVIGGKTYRVTVSPFLTPTTTLTVTVQLNAGAGSGIISLLCSGLGTGGSSNTYDVLALAKGTPGGVVSFTDVTRSNNGVFFFDVTIAASSGLMSFSSPDGYANITVV